MTDDHLEHLISGHLQGTLTSREFAELEERLLHSAADRERFWEEAELHAMLHSSLQGSLAVKAEPKPKTGRAFLWRPLTAAAAGLVVGLFSASLVFGYMMPRAVATASRIFSLAEGSFETAMGRMASGFPSEFGLWSGDSADVVGTAVVEAADGAHALRFVRAEREETLPNYGAASCDVYQLVDLTALRTDADLGEATLELSVQFRDARESGGELVKFICRLYLFSGKPDSLHAEWPVSQKDALAGGSGNFDSVGGAPSEWHRVTTKVLMPPGADFAVIHLLAHKPKNPTGTEAAFGEQFADDVQLTLKTQPTLPVRLAQR